MKITRRTLAALAGSVGLAASLAISTAPPVAAQDRLDEIVTKAGEEGAVVVNVSTTRFPAASARGLSRAISEKFGVDITVELANFPPVPVSAGQVVQEHQAGVKPTFDAFPMPLAFTAAIAEGGAVEDIDWAGIGVDPELIDPNGKAIWINTIPRAVYYNTELVTGDDIPTRLEDLLDPKWKGKIAGPGFGDAYGIISVPVLGEERAAEWLKALYEEQELAVIRSMSEVPNRVANGEFAIGMGVPANHTGWSPRARRWPMPRSRRWAANPIT